MSPLLTLVILCLSGSFVAVSGRSEIVATKVPRDMDAYMRQRERTRPVVSGLSNLIWGIFDSQATSDPVIIEVDGWTAPNTVCFGNGISQPIIEPNFLVNSYCTAGESDCTKNLAYMAYFNSSGGIAGYQTYYMRCGTQYNGYSGVPFMNSVWLFTDPGCQHYVALVNSPATTVYNGDCVAPDHPAQTQLGSFMLTVVSGSIQTGPVGLVIASLAVATLMVSF